MTTRGQIQDDCAVAGFWRAGVLGAFSALKIVRTLPCSAAGPDPGHGALPPGLCGLLLAVAKNRQSPPPTPLSKSARQT